MKKRVQLPNLPPSQELLLLFEKWKKGNPWSSLSPPYCPLRLMIFRSTLLLRPKWTGSPHFVCVDCAVSFFLTSLALSSQLSVLPSFPFMPVTGLLFCIAFHDPPEFGRIIYHAGWWREETFEGSMWLRLCVSVSVSQFRSWCWWWVRDVRVDTMDVRLSTGSAKCGRNESEWSNGRRVESQETQQWLPLMCS